MRVTRFEKASSSRRGRYCEYVPHGGSSLPHAMPCLPACLPACHAMPCRAIPSADKHSSSSSCGRSGWTGQGMTEGAPVAPARNPGGRGKARSWGRRRCGASTSTDRWALRGRRQWWQSLAIKVSGGRVQLCARCPLPPHTTSARPLPAYAPAPVNMHSLRRRLALPSHTTLSFPV